MRTCVCLLVGVGLASQLFVVNTVSLVSVQTLLQQDVLLSNLAVNMHHLSLVRSSLVTLILSEVTVEI